MLKEGSVVTADLELGSAYVPEEEERGLSETVCQQDVAWITLSNSANRFEGEMMTQRCQHFNKFLKNLLPVCWLICTYLCIQNVAENDQLYIF